MSHSPVVRLIFTAAFLMNSYDVPASDQTDFDNYLVVKRFNKESNPIYPGDVVSGEVGVCEYDSVVLGIEPFSDELTISLLDIAGVIIHVKQNLLSAGSIRVWHPELVKLEAELVAFAHSNQNHQLVRKKIDQRLEQYTLFLKSHGLRVHAGGTECGAGGYVEVIFKTEPSGGIISMISELNYELCRLKGIQDDPNQCSAWRVAKDTESISGAYFVKIDWPNRSFGPKRYDFNPWGGTLQKEITLP